MHQVESGGGEVERIVTAGAPGETLVAPFETLIHGENDAEHIEEVKKRLAMVLPDAAVSKRIVRTAQVTARLYALKIEEILA